MGQWSKKNLIGARLPETIQNVQGHASLPAEWPQVLGQDWQSIFGEKASCDACISDGVSGDASAFEAISPAEVQQAAAFLAQGRFTVPGHDGVQYHMISSLDETGLSRLAAAFTARARQSIMTDGKATSRNAGQDPLYTVRMSLLPK